MAVFRHTRQNITKGVRQMRKSEYYNRLNWAYPEPLPDGFVKPDHFDPEPIVLKAKKKSFEITLSNFESDKAIIAITKNSDNSYTLCVDEE